MAETNSLLSDIADVGAAPHGGYARHLFNPADHALREWFQSQARSLGLDVEVDRNSNIWAWWGQPGEDAVVTGSHLDSVPGGGAFDGPLGVAGALAAVERLQQEYRRPPRPFAVVAFAEEEGSRFGVACLGSRLLSGRISRDRALALKDPDGVSLAEAARASGFAPDRFGRDDEALARIGVFIESHIEQGRGLIDMGRPVGVGSSIFAHGRWRMTFTGVGNHAGTTAIDDRHDPMLAAASAVLAARRVAAARSVRATIGRLVPRPGGTNVIASSVDAWLDVRAGEDAVTRSAVDAVLAAARTAAADEGCRFDVTEESYGADVHFDRRLADRLSATLGDAPQLATGAGHDAGILAAAVPTAMLYIRNPTGVSHAPDEYAEPGDIETGTDALVTVLKDLL